MGKCIVFKCRGNYRGEPYSEFAKIPYDTEVMNSWISALPNVNPEKLKKRKEL